MTGATYEITRSLPGGEAHNAVTTDAGVRRTEHDRGGQLLGQHRLDRIAQHVNWRGVRSQ